jgi:hypothetical protein
MPVPVKQVLSAPLLKHSTSQDEIGIACPNGKGCKGPDVIRRKAGITIHKKIYRQKSMKEGIGSFVLDRNLNRILFL